MSASLGVVLTPDLGPTVGNLVTLTGSVGAILLTLAKLASLWGKAKTDAEAQHDRRFSDSWKRQGELLDDAQADNARLRDENTGLWAERMRLRAELAECWQRVEVNRRKSPRPSPTHGHEPRHDS